MTEATNVFYAIPARGGSKRLERKNMLSLLGKPMIQYTIEAALGAAPATNIYVCTDDQDTATLAGSFDIQVPRLLRPEECGETVPSYVPCWNLLEESERAAGRLFDIMVVLQPTSPMRTARDITAALSLFGSHDAVASIAPLDQHYAAWTVKVEDEKLVPYWGADALITDRHDLPEVYILNGAIKAVKTAAFRATGSIWGTNLGGYVMAPERSIHIATEVDFKMTEFLMEKEKEAI